MLRKKLLTATVVLITMASVQPGIAADPPGSTPSDPRPSAPTPAAIPMPDRGPADLTIGRLVPPPDPIDDLTARDPNAGLDQQIDALLGANLPGGDGGFGFQTASPGNQTASSANCWDNGAGCGPGGQPQFEANCHSQQGGLSSHDDGEGGTYVKCTLPSH